MSIVLTKSLIPTFNIDGYFDGNVNNSYEDVPTNFIAGYNNNVIRWTSSSERQSQLVWWKDEDYGEPADGDYVKLNLNGKEYTFIFKTSPNETGYELPLRGSLTLAQYATLLEQTIETANCFKDGTFTVTCIEFSSSVKFTIIGDALSSFSTFDDASNYNYTSVTGIFQDYGYIKINNNLFTKLVARADNNYTYNILEVVKKLFGKFKDTYVHNLSDFFIYDNNLILKLDVEVGIRLTNNATETHSLELYALRAVHQIGDIDGESMVSFDPTVFSTSNIYSTSALLKFDGKYKRSLDKIKQNTLTVFKGFPLDVAIIDTPDSRKIKLEFIRYSGSLGGSVSHTMTAGLANDFIKRIILSDGADKLAILPDNSKGILSITTQDDSNNDFSRYYMNFEVVDECGVYFKFLNSEGGWSYFLFNKYFKMPMTVKSLGDISEYNETMIGANGNVTNIGQQAAVGIKVAQRFVSRDQYTQAIEIVTSPCVYFYKGEKGQQATAADWLRVRIVDAKPDFRDTERQAYNLSFMFNLPDYYTQTL